MSQPWEENKSQFQRIGIRKRIKDIVKNAPIAIAMVGVTYLCFLHMSLVKKDPDCYNTNRF